MIVPDYPESAELIPAMRGMLHPRFQTLADGISELTFANLYLFRKAHHYRIARLPDEGILISGSDGEARFFIIPFGLPDRTLLGQIFNDLAMMKCVSKSQAEQLSSWGYEVSEDRDNFDYLYRRQDLATLSGRKFHKKRNLINAFINRYAYEGRPLLEEYLPDALRILETWRRNREEPGDYEAAKEALERAEDLQLCGGIYYVDGQPAAYSFGEELAQGQSFAIHFEKAVSDYKGLWQFVNQAFASILPDHYMTINREQDLGNKGLRHAKLSYNPIGFVKKFRAVQPE